MNSPWVRATDFQLKIQVLSTWLASSYSRQADPCPHKHIGCELGGSVYIFQETSVPSLSFCQKKKFSCTAAGGRGYFCSLTKSHYLHLVVIYLATAIFIQVWSKWVKGQGDKRVTHSLGLWSLLHSYLHICILLISIVYFQVIKIRKFQNIFNRIFFFFFR